MTAFKSDDGIDFDKHWTVEQKGAPDFSGQDPRAIFDYALPFLPDRPFRLLEIGCGIGKWSPPWEELGATYEGIDASSPGIEEARRRYPNRRFYQGLVQEMGFEGGFDVVFSHAFLQHTHADTKRQIFPRLHRALTESGVMVLQENCNNGDTETTFFREGWIRFIEPFGFKYVAGTDDDKLKDVTGWDRRNGMVFTRLRV
jgi:SAM-dependent methyltransferase